jgi:glycosyltransferase involved in cell wall biosynthesis
MDKENLNLKMLSESCFFGSKYHTSVPSLSTLPPMKLSRPLDIQLNRNIAVISPNDSNDIRKIFNIGNMAIDVIQDSLWSEDGNNSLDISGYVHASSLKRRLLKRDSVIVVNALECLQDFRPILATLRDYCIETKKQVLISGDLAKKNNNRVFRNWDYNGIKLLIQSSGFSISDDMSTDSMYIFMISCSKDSYGDFLNINNLPDDTFSHLLVTTEHSGYRITGGIGSYINECEHLYGTDAGVLIIDNNNDVNLKKLNKNKWLFAQKFLTTERISQIESANYDTMADLIFEVIQSIQFYYTNLLTIECQEMGLYRTIEAKKIGLIHSQTKLITTCHGSSFHLAKAKRDIIDLENIHVAYREKFTLEESDAVVFPTNFLKESYRDSGILGLDDASRIIKRLPFNFNRLPEGESLEEYKKLIYIGKTSTIKGFDLFLRTLLELSLRYPKIKENIEEVAVFATSLDIHEQYIQELFNEVSNVYNINLYSLEREDLLSKLAITSKESLSLVTYTGDNHPMVVLELMGIGHDFIAAEAGGTPELIPNKFRSKHLVAPNEVDFTRKIVTAFETISERRDDIKKLTEIYKKEQDYINKQYSLESLKILPAKSSPVIHKNIKQNQILVEIIDMNNKEQLSKTLKSLETQKVVFDVIVSKKPTVKDIVSFDYIRLYAGDVLMPHALKYLTQLIRTDNKTAAAMSYLQTPTREGEKLIGNTYHTPYSPELGSVYLQEKYYRRVVAIFRKGTDISHPYFSDWQRCIAAVSMGFSVRTVPKKLAELTDIGVGEEQGSNEYNSKMAHSFKSLPVFDAYILNYQLKRLDDIYFGSKLFNHLQDIYIRRDDPSITYGISANTVQALEIYEKYVPSVIKLIVRKSVKLCFKSARSIKKLL